MCGIVGMFKKHKRHLSDKMSYMLKKINHRGPDSSGIYENDEVCIGHTRLSIIGVDNGKQPITSHGITVAVNGEFYDYKDLKKELSLEYEFLTDSDSEILIPLYLKYGAYDMMKYLNGEFAFILYDSNNHRLYACRDRFGIKPLVYKKEDDELWFSSEAKVFDDLSWNDDVLIRILSFHYQQTDKTVFKDVYQVEPGTILIIDENGYRKMRYYDIDYSDKIVGSVDEFKHKLINSVKKRLVSDVPICCHLSGGLDSSSVLGISSKLLGRSIDSFTIAFSENAGDYNELAIAKRTAKFCKSDLHVIEMTQQDIIDSFDNAVMMSEGVAVNGHISCKHLLNKKIREAGFKVALTGEGADECLLGYSHLKHDLGYNRNFSMTAGTEYPVGSILDVSPIEKVLGYVPSFIAAKMSMGSKFRDMMSIDFLVEAKKHNIAEELVNELHIADHHYESNAETSMYLWMKTALPNYILKTLGDGCEMPSSVEGRLPFLDYELVDYAASLPVSMKYGNGFIEKKILREALKGEYITDEIYRREKQPFQAPPVTQYFTEKTWNEVTGKILEENCKTSQVFDKTKIKQMLEYVKSGNVEVQTVYEPIVMILLSINALQKLMRK